MARKSSSVAAVAVGVTLVATVLGLAGIGAAKIIDTLEGGPGGKAEKYLLTTPAYAKVMAEMKQHYPDDEEHLRARVRRVAAGITHPDERKEKAEELADDYVATLVYPSGWVAPAASPEALSEVAATRLAALKALKAYNVNTCGRFAIGAPLRDRPPVEIRTAINDSAAALMRAVYEGDQRRGRVPVATRNDNKALADRLKASGLTDADLETVTSWRSRDAIPREKSCQIAIAIYRSMAALPADVRGRLMAQTVTGGGWGGVLREGK